MADQFDPLASLEATQDVLSRAGFGSDKRKRRAAIELGKSNPSSFTSDFSSQITEAQQPQEWAGAGRQLAARQDVAPDIANIFKGSLHKTGNEMFYYGPDDYSTAQLGTQGYRTEDLGSGKYNIFDNDNNLLGTGYKSLDDTIREMYHGGSFDAFLKKNPIIPSNESDSAQYYNWVNPSSPMGEEGRAATQFKTMEEAMAAARNYYNTPLQQSQMHYKTPGDISDLQRWEQIGLGLTGQEISLYENNPWRNFGATPQTENITGLNTLYGSSPLLWNNKLLGYKMDMTPAEKSDWGYKNPFLQYTADTHGDTQSYGRISRELNNPATWANLVTGLGDGNVFVSSENAAKLPGWQNTSGSAYQEADDGGLFGKVFNVLDPLLDKADPLHDTTQSAIADIIGADSQKEAFLKIVPTVLSIFGGPWGAAANAANAVSNDDIVGALLSTAGADWGDGSAISNTLGASTGLADLSSSVSKVSGLSPATVQKVLNSGLTSAVSAGLRGGNPLTSGSIAGLASLFGAGLGNVSGSKFLDKLGTSAASFGLNALFNKKGKTAGEDIIKALPMILNATGNTKASPESSTSGFKPQIKSIHDIYKQRFFTET